MRQAFLLIILLTLSAQARRQTWRLGEWRISNDASQRALSLTLRGRTILVGIQPEATYVDASGKEYSITFANAVEMQPLQQSRQSVTLSVTDQHGVQLHETFSLTGDGILVGASLHASDSIASRYLAPLHITRPYTLFPEGGDCRMLKVPFDNDGFVRYHHFPFGSEMTSFEAAAFYHPASRRGLVIGSIDHDHWKSGITAQTDTTGCIVRLSALSGISHSETRDVLPHGMLRGRDIASARFFVSFSDDWRRGMEAFADACTHVVAGRRNWTRGTPFGWQSWGVMAEKNSFQVDDAVSRYMAETLVPAGFRNEQGITVLSIDSWDNLSDEQKRTLCRLCKQRGQVPGTYWTPFSLWWGADGLDHQKLPGQDVYMASECVLKANGEYLKYDGAYCLDPTHPGVKAWIAAEISRIKALGFEYLKVDFTDNGMIQADSYYNPQVHTAVEAYNEGFTYLCQCADEGEPLFIAQSIAPLFPYQYGNSRRIACDTWGRISHSEYCMNAISGGWWTDRLYQYNDPDHCPLIGRDADVATTEAENRARYTTLLCAGMLLVCDNYDLNDRSGRGDARLSRERAQRILMNEEVNAVGRLGRSFRPVNGCSTLENNHERADNVFTLRTDSCTFVAVFNYGETPLQGTLSWQRLDVKRSRSVRELWMSQPQPLTRHGLTYDVPAHDARLYRVE